MSEQDTKPGNVVSLIDKLGTPTAANVPPAVTDIARLRDAFDRLEDAGFVVLDGGCCSSCNWGHIDREHPEAEDVVHVNDQALDGAFGEIEPSIEWRAYLDAALGEAETDARYEQWLDHWYSDDFVGLDPRVAQRPGMLKASLWLQHDGDTARAITILRAAGLDAQWNGDPKTAIEVKARGCRRAGDRRDRCRERRAVTYGRCAVKKRKLISWPKKKNSAKKHRHQRQAPSRQAVQMAAAILRVLYANDGTANIHDVADELLGQNGYQGSDARVFDEAFAYALHYGAIEIDTFCEHEKPALIRMRAMLPLLPLVGPDGAVRMMICVHCGLAHYKPIYDDRLPDVIIAFKAAE